MGLGEVCLRHAGIVLGVAVSAEDFHRLQRSRDWEIEVPCDQRVACGVV